MNVWGGFNFTMHSSTVSNNQAQNSAGGVYLGRLAAINLFACVFSGNRAGYGGAAYAELAVSTSLKLTACTFHSNRVEGARSEGGALYAHPRGSNNIELEQCVFTKNFAAVHGGAIRVEPKGNPLAFISLKKCNVSANSAGKEGGALCTTGSSVLLEDTSLHANAQALHFPLQLRLIDQLVVCQDAVYLISSSMVLFRSNITQTKASQKLMRLRYNESVYAEASMFLGGILGARWPTQAEGSFLLYSPDCQFTPEPRDVGWALSTAELYMLHFVMTLMSSVCTLVWWQVPSLKWMPSSTE